MPLLRKKASEIEYMMESIEFLGYWTFDNPCSTKLSNVHCAALIKCNLLPVDVGKKLIWHG